MAYNGLRTAFPLRDALAATMASQTRRNAASLVHLQGLWDGASLALALLRNPLECPLVVSPRGMLEPWALAQRKIKKKAALGLWQQGLLTKATILHATSQMEYEGFRRLGLRNPVAIVPNGELTPPMRFPVATAPQKRTSHTLVCLGPSSPARLDARDCGRRR
jgi:hypothetical protein